MLIVDITEATDIENYSRTSNRNILWTHQTCCTHKYIATQYTESYIDYNCHVAHKLLFFSPVSYLYELHFYCMCTLQFFSKTERITTSAMIFNNAAYYCFL